MDQLHSITFTPNRERGQHLKFEERCMIKTLRKLGYSLCAIAKAVNCSPSTVLYELKRGTDQRTGSRGRFPEYSAKRGQCSYQINRSRCHRKAVALNGNPFIDWLIQKVLKERWSINACVGYARKSKRFPAEFIVCTKTIYHAVWSGQIRLRPLDLPEALKRSSKHNRVRSNKKYLAGAWKNARLMSLNGSQKATGRLIRLSDTGPGRSLLYSLFHYGGQRF